MENCFRVNQERRNEHLLLMWILWIIVDNEGQRHESEHELHHDGEKGATFHSKTDQEHHCHYCEKVMSNEHDLMFHELAHDLDQMDYSGEGPWSPLIPNSTCEPMEEDHVTDQEMAPESMETDEASTSTRTNSPQIGFGGVKKIPYTIQKVGERTIMKNNAVDINYNIRFNAENPEQGMRLSDLLRELEDMFDNVITEAAQGLALFWILDESSFITLDCTILCMYR